MRLFSHRTYAPAMPPPTSVPGLVAFAMLASAMGGVASGQIIRVNDDAPGPTHDGDTWDTAFTTLQQALTIADPGDSIWVAQGTYAPTALGSNPPMNPTDEDFTFEIPSGVGVYGGFDATEMLFQERANLFDRTILTGALTSGADAYTVVTLPPGTAGTRIDGFRITAARGDVEETTAAGRGGGLLAEGTNSFTLANITFYDCESWQGGGAWVDGGSFQMKHVIFDRCVALNKNGALGGGLYVTGLDGDSFIHSVVFRDCHAQTDINNGLSRQGGGMYAGFLGARLEVVNGLFHDCAAGRGGAASVAGTYSPHGVSWINCTFSQNRAGYIFGLWSGDASAIWLEEAGLHYTVENSILWNNFPVPGKPDTIVIGSGSPIAADYSDIEAQTAATPPYTGANNISVDPQFFAPSLNDFRLATGSPCIEVGDNSRVPIDATDLDDDDDVSEQLPWALVKNYIRIASTSPPPSVGVVDMGAHERPAVIN